MLSNQTVEFENASGDSAWTQLLLQGMESGDKQFLAGYLCASLYYLIEDTHSRQCLLADSKASTAIIKALLAAGSSTAVLVSLCACSCLVLIFCSFSLQLTFNNMPPKGYAWCHASYQIGILIN